ncbi:hypothetical protein [Bacillus sp. FJAT-52991]|uniref:Lipoprotein n=1 Tax=Bacillus kandeliae TaxID=3129297 RepID=A0ABZ2N5B5_9BACI
MNRGLFIFIFMMSCYLIGCSNEELTVEKPPEASVQIGEQTYKTTLGSYCWSGEGKNTCVDKAGPVELLVEKTPIKVSPGEKITFLIDHKQKPSKVEAVQFHKNKETDVLVKDHQLTAPMEKGVYYYSYGVWWNDEKEPDVSNGDAFYAFVIEVE